MFISVKKEFWGNNDHTRSLSAGTTCVDGVSASVWASSVGVPHCHVNHFER